MRIKVVQIIIGAAFLFLSIGLFYHQILYGRKYRQLSQANCIRINFEEGGRGRILDRNGNPLVSNRLSYGVAIMPQESQDLNKVFNKLVSLLGIPFNDIQSQFKKGIISPSMPVTLVEDIDRKKAIILEELKFDFPGIVIQTVPQRFYPYGMLGAHLIGYLAEIDHWRLTKLKDYGYKTKDTIGYSGIEERYDYYLRPQQGGLQVEVDSRNRIVRAIGFKPPRNGRDVQLTLDLRIQKIVEESLKDKTGAIIILDPYTGEILALVSFPNFHPAWFIKKSPRIKSLFGDYSAPLLNRAISGVYPAGSIFKVIVATAGLENKKVNLNKIFYCEGGIRLGSAEFACWDRHAGQNLIQAIAHSCNVFFYRLGLLVGPDMLYEYALKFGFARPTQIDLSGEKEGLVPSPLRKRLNKFKAWFDGDTVNFSIGQGELLVTPLQITRMMALFANGGNLVRPYLIKSIDGKDVSNYKRKIVSLKLNTNTLAIVRQGLKAAVDDTEGTAHILKFDLVQVAGKTGTAQTARGQSHAWFAGYFPVEKPKFTICVFLEHGGPSFNACLVAKEIIEKMHNEGLL